VTIEKHRDDRVAEDSQVDSCIARAGEGGETTRVTSGAEAEHANAVGAGSATSAHLVLNGGVGDRVAGEHRVLKNARIVTEGTQPRSNRLAFVWCVTVVPAAGQNDDVVDHALKRRVAV
jgi:hypothetical protein